MDVCFSVLSFRVKADISFYRHSCLRLREPLIGDMSRPTDNKRPLDSPKAPEIWRFMAFPPHKISKAVYAPGLKRPFETPRLHQLTGFSIMSSSEFYVGPFHRSRTHLYFIAPSVTLLNNCQLPCGCLPISFCKWHGYKTFRTDMNFICLAGERSTVDPATSYNGTLSAKVGLTQRREYIQHANKRKVKGVIKGVGSGPTKSSAKQIAAEQALRVSDRVFKTRN